MVGKDEQLLRLLDADTEVVCIVGKSRLLREVGGAVPGSSSHYQWVAITR